MRSQGTFAMNWMDPEHQSSLTSMALSIGNRSQFVVEMITWLPSSQTNMLDSTSSPARNYKGRLHPAASSRVRMQGGSVCRRHRRPILILVVDSASAYVSR